MKDPTVPLLIAGFLVFLAYEFKFFRWVFGILLCIVCFFAAYLYGAYKVGTIGLWLPNLINLPR